jgi:hypothetical protein
MFVAIVIVLLFRVFSLYFGYILPSTSSAVDKSEPVANHPMLALIGKSA